MLNLLWTNWKLRVWCSLFHFFMWFARFQILVCEPQCIWRKLLVLSWLYCAKKGKLWLYTSSSIYLQCVLQCTRYCLSCLVFMNVARYVLWRCWGHLVVSVCEGNIGPKVQILFKNIITGQKRAVRNTANYNSWLYTSSIYLQCTVYTILP